MMTTMRRPSFVEQLLQETVAAGPPRPLRSRRGRVRFAAVALMLVAGRLAIAHLPAHGHPDFRPTTIETMVEARQAGST